MRARTVALIVFTAVVLVGGASARGVSTARSLNSDRAVARYLVSLGINPDGVVIQRGARNYAGPGCPGVGWNCTTARNVAQVSTTSSGVNLVTCVGSGGTTSASGSGAGTGAVGCTIVQTSTSANNSATCTEQSQVGTPSPVTQTCSITQTSSTGSNTANVTQQIQQGPVCGLVPTIASSQQTQSSTQSATVIQNSQSGNGTANVTQNTGQCAASFTPGGITQSQTTYQEFTVRQNIPNGFDSTNTSCDATGTSGQLQTTASQSQHQYGFALIAASGTEKQHSDLIGHIDQCSSGGEAHYTAKQSEDQYLGKNSHLQQTQEGPGHCCSYQGTQPADTCTITQTASQQANPNATQAELLTSEAGTTGSCSGNISSTQNTTTNTASSSGSNVAASLDCDQGTCGPTPTAVAWSGDTSGAYHDRVTLAGTLTRTDTNAGVSGQSLQLQAGAESCTAGPTDSSGYASCDVTLGDVPGGSYTAQATFAGSTGFQNSASTPVAFTVDKQPTTISYTGPTTARYDDPVDLTAQLLEGTGNAVDDGTAVDVTLGSQGCSGGGAVATSGGVATCHLTIQQAPGGYTASANFGGNAYYLASGPAPQAFTVTKRDTVLTYTGAADGDYNDPFTFTGTLTEDSPGFAPIAGRVVTFQLGTQSCVSGPSDSSGAVSCTLTKITQAPGSVTTVSASFDGSLDTYYISSATSPGFTIDKEEVTITYSGQTNADYSDPASFKAKLTDDDGVTVLSGQTLTFQLGTDSCTGTTSSTGFASCSISKVHPLVGPNTVNVVFGGNTLYKATTTGFPFTVTTEETSVSNTGATSAKKGTSASVSAKLSWDDGPISGATVTFTLTSGGSCTATTNASGVAACSLPVGSTAGTYSLTIAYTGDPTRFEPASKTVSFRITSS